MPKVYQQLVCAGDMYFAVPRLYCAFKESSWPCTFKCSLRCKMIIGRCHVADVVYLLTKKIYADQSTYISGSPSDSPSQYRDS